MKNKKLLYILIPATVFIWGAIAYTIFSHLRQNFDFDEVQYLPDLQAGSESLQSSYTLLANYSDPFRIRKKKTHVVRKKTAAPTIRHTQTNLPYNRPVQQRIYWPAVIYNGLIMNEQKQVALIQIDSKKFLITEGEERERIRLLKMFPDSVRLEFEGETKTFKKK